MPDSHANQCSDVCYKLRMPEIAESGAAGGEQSEPPCLYIYMIRHSSGLLVCLYLIKCKIKGEGCFFGNLLVFGKVWCFVYTSIMKCHGVLYGIFKIVLCDVFLSKMHFVQKFWHHLLTTTTFLAP